MGIRDALAVLFGAGTPFPNVTYTSFGVDEILGQSAEELYRTQPHLRTVVSFVARNVAQLGWPAYQRVSDTDRRRLSDDPVARVLSRPNGSTTGYELREQLVSDLALYDIAYWYLWNDVTAGWQIRAIPPSWVTGMSGSDVFAPDAYQVQAPNGARLVTIPADQMLVFHGWNPGNPRKGSSPVETLKQVLAEQIQAWSFRQQMWARGGRVGSYLTRPAGSAEWSPEARKKFQRNWSEFSARGGKAGTTPVLEDGMELKRVGFSAREDEYSEVAKLSLSTVASVYQVNPVMVGVLDNANFSNTREFRKMLYSETLGPTIAMIEDRINQFLVPIVTSTPNVYVEFNIKEKLQGDFLDTAAVLSSSVGAPWMTRNEARALDNLPAITGGDALVTPLNVIEGGQSSPRDSGSQNQNSGVVRTKDGPFRIKSEGAPEADVVKAQEILSAFFKRQRSVVLSRLGSKSADAWWDADRWDSELSDDIYKLAVNTATKLGRKQAEQLGFKPDDYDEARTLKFLRAVAAKRAEWINGTTKAQIDAVLADDGDPGDVFDVAETQRTGTAGKALMTAVAGFAFVEAGKQLVGARAEKTWVTGDNPRPEHADMDGETVGIEETFSNGADWPGDPVLGAEGVANCNCGVAMSF